MKNSINFNQRLTSSWPHMGAICEVFPLDLHWAHPPLCIDMEYMCKQCLADQAVSGLRSVPVRGRYTPPSTASYPLLPSATPSYVPPSYPHHTLLHSATPSTSLYSLSATHASLNTFPRPMHYAMPNQTIFTHNLSMVNIHSFPLKLPLLRKASLSFLLFSP